MNAPLTLGEYMRRLRRAKRWGLQELSEASGLSVSHLSRIENDSALPNVETVVKLSNALGADLEVMLEQAQCLPQEIMDRLLQRANGDQTAVRRSAGDGADPGFARALIEEIDPRLREALEQRFRLSPGDIDGLFTLLQRLAAMRPEQRAVVLDFLGSGDWE
jgi:transcriptional regulator with XRE-family HTH domain